MNFENDQNPKKVRVVAETAAEARETWSDALELEREIGFWADGDVKAAIGNLKQAANQVAQLLGLAGPDFHGVPWFDHPRVIREWIEDNGLS